MVALLAAGCGEPKRSAMFTPMQRAVGIVEANRDLVRTGLKASGSARGFFVDDRGRKQHFDLGAKLQVVPPSHMRFVLQNAFGQDELEVGMNADKWWLLVHRPGTRYFEDAVGVEPGVAIGGTVPLRADQLMESLGLGALSAGQAGARVVDDYQQLIFMGTGADGRVVIAKEYWLDRYEPRLTGRIVFRDDEGRAVLSSCLTGYGAVGDSGLKLPYELRLSWPAEEAELVFRVGRWQELERLTTEHPAFVSPRDRGGRYDTEIVGAD